MDPLDSLSVVILIVSAVLVLISALFARTPTNVHDFLSNIVSVDVLSKLSTVTAELSDVIVVESTE